MANSISALTEATSIQDNSIFVVAQQDKYICKKYNSCQISGMNLVNVLKDKVFKMRKFNEVAYMLSDEFSETEHYHDDKYNDLDISIYYKSPKEDPSMISIGNIFIDGTLKPVSLPLSAVTQIWNIPFTIVEPKVGMLKFVALSSIGSNATIAYKSDAFDGWLYPDGSTFNLADFALSTDINALFGTGDGRTFRLPAVKNFIKPNGNMRKESGSMISELDGKNVLYKHVHNIDLMADIDISMTLRIPTSTSAGNGGRLHTGNGKIFYIDPSSRIKTPTVTVNGEEFTLYNYIKSKGIKKNTVNITQFEDALKEVDAENKQTFFNEKGFYDTYKEINILDFNQIPNFSISAQMSLGSTLNIQPAGNDDDETYPTYMNLPVMIYVGSKRRSYK